MGKHRNAKQDTILLLFMQNHVDLATEDPRCSDIQPWQDLAKELNAAGPPIRSTSEWRRTWRSCKHLIGKKLSQGRRLSSSRLNESKLLTPWERKVNAILRKNPSSATKKQNVSSAQDAAEHFLEENQESLHVEHDIPTDVCGTSKDETQDLGTSFDPNVTTVMDNPNESTDSPFHVDNNNNGALSLIAGEISSLNATTSAATDAILAMGSRICNLLEKGLEERQQHNALMSKLLDKINGCK